MTKKEKEISILSTVYESPEFIIKESEEPDFLLSFASADKIFGVEITELFIDESNARIRNSQGYLHDLLHGKKYRHKDDINKLRVSTFSVYNEKNEFQFKVDGVIKDHEGIDAYRDVFIDTLSKKDKKFLAYDKSGTHINLIVHDTEAYFQNVPMDSFNRAFLNIEIRREILSSPFNEIFFVTKTKAYDDYATIIHLKLTVVLVELYLFDNFFDEYYGSEHDKKTVLGNIKAYFNLLGFTMDFAVDDDVITTYLGNTKIVSKAGKSSIYLNPDFVAESITPNYEAFTNMLSNDFLRFIERRRIESTNSIVIYTKAKNLLYHQKKGT